MDPSSFPKSYGGELDWQWGDMPNLDEAAHERLQNVEQPPAEGKTKKDILKGPMLFKGDKIEVLGTEDGKERRSTIPVPQQEQKAPETQANGAEATEASKESSEAITTDDDVAQTATTLEKTGLDNVAVNVNQVSDETKANTAAA